MSRLFENGQQKGQWRFRSPLSRWHWTRESFPAYYKLGGLVIIVTVTPGYVVTRLWGGVKNFVTPARCQTCHIHCYISSSRWVILPPFFQIIKPRLRQIKPLDLEQMNSKWWSPDLNDSLADLRANILGNLASGECRCVFSLRYTIPPPAHHLWLHAVGLVITGWTSCIPT